MRQELDKVQNVEVDMAINTKSMNFYKTFLNMVSALLTTHRVEDIASSSL